MTATHIEEVVVEYDPAWRKWPDTNDVDYTNITKKPATRSLQHQGHSIDIVSWTYPVHSAFRYGPRKPAGPGCWEFANYNFPEWAIDEQIEDLRQYSKHCQVILWPHARCLNKRTMDALPELFPLRVLRFGDDCPGSSEHKTFPYAYGFNALLHNMYVWRYDTGERVATKYKELGITYTRFVICGPSNGLGSYLKRTDFDVKRKAEAIAAGIALPIGLSFVGYYTPLNPARQAFMDGLAEQRDLLHTAGLTTRLHGACYDTGDGPLEPFSLNDGSVPGALYVNSLFGVNYPNSSLYNTRLFDLWMCGAVQLIHDKNGELQELGVLPGEHYIPFDGTAVGMIKTVLDWLDRRQQLADMILRAHEFGAALAAKYSSSPAHDQMYLDHLDLLR